MGNRTEKKFDKKSFIRGFGVGIIFAAVITGVSYIGRTSDSAVIDRAKELGMEFSSTDEKINLADLVNASGEASSEEDETGKASDKSAERTPVPTSSTTVEHNKSGSDADNQGETTQKTDSDTTDVEKDEKKLEDELEDAENTLDNHGNSKQITIYFGDWSEKISKELEDLGIIENAYDFNRYLVDNGLSSRINTGVYDIDVDATYDEIVDQITSR